MDGMKGMTAALALFALSGEPAVAAAPFSTPFDERKWTAPSGQKPRQLRDDPRDVAMAFLTATNHWLKVTHDSKIKTSALLEERAQKIPKESVENRIRAVLDQKDKGLNLKQRSDRLLVIFALTPISDEMRAILVRTRETSRVTDMLAKDPQLLQDVAKTTKKIEELFGLGAFSRSKYGKQEIDEALQYWDLRHRLKQTVKP